MSNDFVDGPASEFPDYTKEDVKTPFDDNPGDIDDNESIDVDVLPGVTDKDIDKMTLRFLEAGDHIVKIKKIEWADPDPQTRKGKIGRQTVFVKDERTGQVRPKYYSFQLLKLIMCKPDDELNTAIDKIQLFAGEPEEKEAFEHGFKNQASAEKNSRQQGGWHARKLKSLLGKLGFTFDVKGNAEPASQRLGNWRFLPNGKPRLLGLKLKLGDPVLVKGKPGEPAPTNPDGTPKTMRFTSVDNYFLVPNQDMSVPQVAKSPEPVKEVEPAAKKGKKTVNV